MAKKKQDASNDASSCRLLQELSQHLLAANKTIPTGPSLKRAREPSPDANQSKRLRLEFPMVYWPAAGRKGNDISQASVQKKIDFANNMQYVAELEKTMKDLSIDRVELSDILDDHLRHQVQLSLGHSTVKDILFYMARNGWHKLRPMIFRSLQSLIDRKRKSLESQRIQAKRLKLSGQLQKNQVKAEKNQSEEKQQQKPHSQVKQTYIVVEKQRQDHNHAGKHAPSLTRSDCKIVETAKRVAQHQEMCSLAVVNIATLAAHDSMDAALYYKLTQLASKNPGLSAISLLFGFRAHSDHYKSSASRILRDFISEPLLTKLSDADDSGRTRHAADRLLQEVTDSIVDKNGLVLQHSSTKTPKVKTEVMESHADRMDGHRGSNGKHHSMTVRSNPHLSTKNSVPSPLSLQQAPKPGEIVQVWQLPLRQQQMQSEMFGLHFQTDVVRCLSCCASGHTVEACKAISDCTTGEDCEFCCNFGSDQAQCGHLWRPTTPALAAPTITSSRWTMSCYNCGSNEHWGDACNAMPGIFRH